MPKQRFALEKNDSKRLELAWGVGWRNFTVTLDNIEIGKIEGGQKALKQGKSFSLPDGSELVVRLKTGLATELQVLRDGQPLPGSGSDPHKKLVNSYGIILFVGGLGLVLGVVAALFGVTFLQELGFGWGSIIFGAILAGLGFMVKKGSLTALWIAMGLYALDAILSIAAAMSIGASPVGSIFVRIFFLVAMYQGVDAIKALRREKLLVK
jgi:hypothetical protein